MIDRRTPNHWLPAEATNTGYMQGIYEGLMKKSAMEDERRKEQASAERPKPGRKIGVGEAGEIAEMVASANMANKVAMDIEKSGLIMAGGRGVLSETAAGLGRGYGASPGQPGGRHVELDAKYALLRQHVVRAMQGARMSDKDIEIAKSYTPSVGDDPEQARKKLRFLQEMVNSAVQGRISVLRQLGFEVPEVKLDTPSEQDRPTTQMSPAMAGLGRVLE